MDADTAFVTLPCEFNSISSTYNFLQAVPLTPKSSALSEPGLTLLPPGSNVISAAATIFKSVSTSK